MSVDHQSLRILHHFGRPLPFSTDKAVKNLKEIVLENCYATVIGIAEELDIFREFVPLILKDTVSLRR